jgi:hypothetical protein
VDNGQCSNTRHNDGWHRLAKAQRDGVTELSVAVLNEDQERNVRVFGGDLDPPSTR